MASSLRSFLADPSRPPGTLSYRELQGLLFAIASAPEMVPVLEWIPMVFGGASPGYESHDEARAVLGDLMALYNSINAAVADDAAALPSDVSFRAALLANFDEGAPVSQWSRGVLRGHQWLEESWDPCIPDELDGEFGAMLMALTFFSSKALAQSYADETGRPDLLEMAAAMRDVFPAAVAGYARLGRTIHRVVMSARLVEVPGASKVGRNDPCPCGSGRKYKKCCGAEASNRKA